jgi:protein gp37
MSTKIEWANETWNPIIGCTKVSEGCKNCYAEKMANRLRNIKSTSETYGQVTNIEGNWNGCVHFVDSAIQKPLKWRKPRMIFVCSMGDLFHENVSFEWILEVWFIMEKCPQHTFQILTKRPERMREFLSEWALNPFFEPLKNVWIGVTAENQEQANKRIPILLEIQSAKRFVSCEPLLSEIDFPFINELDWVISGPETGPGSRHMKKEWIQNLYEQCKSVNIPFFDKKNTLGKNLNQFPL